MDREEGREGMGGEGRGEGEGEERGRGRGGGEASGGGVGEEGKVLAVQEMFAVIPCVTPIR